MAGHLSQHKRKPEVIEILRAFYSWPVAGLSWPLWPSYFFGNQERILFPFITAL